MRTGDQPEKAVQSESLNYSVSAYRVLYILLLLVKHRCLALAELNTCLLENPLINRAYNSETITKYINTLRQVGCDIPRANSQTNFQYQLVKNPFPIALQDDELLAANKLLMLLASQPDEVLHVNYYNVLKKVAWAIPGEVQIQMMFGNNGLLLSDSSSVEREQLTRFRELCKDAQVLEIGYAMDSGEEVKLRVEPSRVILSDNILYLVGMDRHNLRRVKLRLDAICDVRQLPFKVQHKVKLTSVVFAVKGRLAKTYRLFPGEAQVSSEPGRLVIRAKTDDYQELLSRLMRYGYACEVVSPVYAREEMRERIARLLTLYSRVEN